MSCTDGNVCYGDACVQCFTDAHCPCGGTCDTALNVCTTSCSDSGDCLGTQFCSPTTQQCEPGRRKPGTEPQGGAPCCEAAPDDSSHTTALALLGLLAVFVAVRSRSRA